jgi:hypothetical protein
MSLDSPHVVVANTRFGSLLPGMLRHPLPESPRHQRERNSYARRRTIAPAPQAGMHNADNDVIY